MCEGYTKMDNLYRWMTHWIMVEISRTCWDLIVPKCKSLWGFMSLSTGLYIWISSKTWHRLHLISLYIIIFTRTYWYTENTLVTLTCHTILFCSDHEGGNVSAHTGHLVCYPSVFFFWAFYLKCFFFGISYMQNFLTYTGVM